MTHTAYIEAGDVVLRKFYTDPLDSSMPKLRLSVNRVRNVERIPVYSHPVLGHLLNDYEILSLVTFTDFTQAPIGECSVLIRPFKSDDQAIIDLIREAQ